MLPTGLLKEHSRLISFALRSLDMLAMFISGLVAFFYKFGDLALPLHYWIALVVGSFVMVSVFSFFHIYDSMRGQSFLSTTKKLVQGMIAVLVLLASLAFLTKTGEDFSRVWFSVWGFITLTAFLLLRYALLLVLRLMRKRGWNERRVIIIGAEDLGLKLAEKMQQALWTGFHIVAIFDDRPAQPLVHANIPVIKTPENINTYLASLPQSVDEIWLALPLSAEARVKEIVHELRHQTLTIRFVLDIFGLDLLNHSISELAGFPMLNLHSTPMVGMNRLIKAIEDRVLASLILILISPLLLMIALSIKCSSKGPVFYRQKRVSWNGKEFDMLKFRTMPVDAESQTGPVWAKAGENRATRIGKLLRKTSLDELPQFINVLRGDMSIVGPRPERPVFVEQFKEQIPRYMQKHLVKAGITGWAQVNGWRGNTSLEKRIEYDLYYIENWSLLFDLKIIVLTFIRGLIHKNAY